MQSCLSAGGGASGPEGFPASGPPAWPVVARVAELRFRGVGSVEAVGYGPRSGELAVFWRPQATAPAVVRRGGTVLADACLPDLVRLGERERPSRRRRARGRRGRCDRGRGRCKAAGAAAEQVPVLQPVMDAGRRLAMPTLVAGMVATSVIDVKPVGGADRR